jgi:hypothetical protein
MPIQAGAATLALFAAAVGFSAPAQAALDTNAIDTTSREAVAAAYKSRWLPATTANIDWSGSVQGCDAGTQSADSLAKSADAINFYRGLDGIDGVSLAPAQNLKAQAAALIMEANVMLDHNPAPSLTCFSPLGALGASSSNLHGGSGGYTIRNASQPVKAYMDDSGQGNQVVGHRRWLLSPSTVTMGVGTTTSFNAINVFGAPTDDARAKPEWMPFPNAGYSPQQLEPQGRWSLSSSKKYDFSAAVVSVTNSEGQALAVTQQPVVNGYGPNTLVFDVAGIEKASGNGESAYTVSVTNVRNESGTTTSHSYTTLLFDGSDAGSGPAPQQVTPAAATFADNNGTAEDTYTIPGTPGVVYRVNGSVADAGTHPGTGTVTVNADAQTGYILAPGATAEWTATFTTGAAPYVPPADSPFQDVSTGQQFYKEMAWLADKDISKGWTEAGIRTYRPLTSINRDAMAAFLYRLAGSPDYTPPADSPFQDVSTGQQFYKEMAWLADKDISKGWTEAGIRTYRPLTSINRDAMAAFLYRLAATL